MLLVFAFTLFCSAMLLFLIEPMVGKMMLPLLGGTPAYRLKVPRFITVRNGPLISMAAPRPVEVLMDMVYP